jgi:penicillin-binding protein A
MTRALPVGVLAVAASVAGILLATGSGSDERDVVRNYLRAWARQDYARMYSALDARSQAERSEPAFVADLEGTAATATMTSIQLIRVGSRRHDYIPARVRVRTRLFGTLTEILRVPLSGSGSSAHVRLARELLFPGLRGAEVLHRDVSLPARGTLLAGDGTPLAEGPTRTSPIPSVAGQIVGTLGPIPATDHETYAAEGYPPGAQVGQDGLERVFQSQLAGIPGGTLFAGRRVLAQRAPVPGQTVKTTIDPKLEQAAVAAMGGQYAGITVMDPRTGGLLALAGVAFSSVQPPGSTMKIITATAALQYHVAKLTDTFADSSSTTIAGYTLQNAGGEVCGGTLLNAFAVSCNSVFAPLGVKVGAARLVATAERFGFNQPTGIPGAFESTIPSASTIGDDLAVGSSAIGQGMVQASSLEMADVGATIAMGGRRPIPTLLAGARPQFVRVTSRHVAHLVQEMMIAVVQFGTGTAAQISGVRVAGKTGTAELRATQGPTADQSQNQNANTDAWFVGYAPVGSPRVVAAALFPNNGAGGATAAPAIRGVLSAALGLG